MRFWLVLIISLVLVATAGCGKQKEPQSETPTAQGPGPIQPTVIDFDKVQEMAPTGDVCKAVHAELQPVFAKVFGGAKLSMFFQMGEGGNHMTYALKRRTAAEDVEPLKKELDSKGYKLAKDSSREELKTLSFQKKIAGKDCQVTVGLTVSDQRLGVAVFY
ncbi:MAG: hypothetical protein AB1510_02785 [Bacillota bacterium]